MHIWQLNDTGDWDAHPLTTAYDLELDATGNLTCVPPAVDWQARLQPWTDGSGAPAYLLLSKAGTPFRLNGLQPLSVSVLRDRDEIALGSAYAYFTTEGRADIVPFTGAGEPIFCARCKSTLNLQGPAVQCPACRLWYHETDGQSCWSYAPTCVCSHPTTGAFAWQPQPVR